MAKGLKKNPFGCVMHNVTQRIQFKPDTMDNRKEIPSILPKGKEYIFGLERVAIFIGVSVPTVKKLISTEKLPYYKIGGKYIFDIEKVRRSVLQEVSNA